MYSVSINPLDLPNVTEKVITGQENKWQLFKIDGLEPPTATINLDTSFESNGGMVNHRKLETRNIVLYIRLNGDVESNRWELYPYTAPNSYIQLRFTTTNRDMIIKGYVQTNEIDFWSMGVVMQVSILCPDPLLKDYNLTTYTATQIRQNVPVVNNGDEPTGFNATLTITSGTVYGIRLVNSTTLDYWQASGSNVFSGSFELCTENGKWDITKSGVSYARYTDVGSKFWQLTNGNNYITYYTKATSSSSWITDSSKISVAIAFRNTYIGA